VTIKGRAERAYIGKKSRFGCLGRAGVDEKHFKKEKEQGTCSARDGVLRGAGVPFREGNRQSGDGGKNGVNELRKVMV